MRSTVTQWDAKLRGDGGLAASSISRHQDPHIAKSRRQQAIPRRSRRGIRQRVGDEHRVRSNFGDAIDLRPGGFTGIDDHMIVTARQGVEIRHHAGRSEKSDPIDWNPSGRDQVQR